MQKKQQITLIYISKVVFFKEFYHYVHVLFNALLLLQFVTHCHCETKFFKQTFKYLVHNSRRCTIVQNVCGSARMFLCLSDTVDESDTSATTTTYDHVVTREPFSSRGWHNALVQYIPAQNRDFMFLFILFLQRCCG